VKRNFDVIKMHGTTIKKLLTAVSDFTARWREVSGSTRGHVRCNTRIQQHPKGVLS